MNANRIEVADAIRDPLRMVNLESWGITGEGITVGQKRLKDLKGVFADEKARLMLDAETLVYTVQALQPVSEDTPGGLFFGNTTLFPGNVKNEYFMTRGHLHSVIRSAEFYWGIKGEGVLILMDEHRVTRGERVFPGSLHYISGNTAHRLANTGSDPLTIGACWYSDAGHNYAEIERNGFSARLLEVDGIPTLVGIHT
jgi:glucose-6-phosphate isomerase